MLPLLPSESTIQKYKNYIDLKNFFWSDYNLHTGTVVPNVGSSESVILIMCVFCFFFQTGAL